MWFARCSFGLSFHVSQDGWDEVGILNEQTVMANSVYWMKKK